nr:MGMT family protein [uncultured Anaerosporobacter sp.]
MNYEIYINIWDALRKIPYGQTRSYKQVAEMIGKLIGYAAGLDIKEKLLELERTHASY